MKDMRHKWSLVVLLVITVFGMALRTYKLGEIPGVMHRDELAVVYNAYSMFKTGQDEWGVSQIWSLKSFGDYKLPAMVYGTIPGIVAFGLNPLGARLPAALYSSLAIPVLYLMIRDLFKSPKMALTASFLLAVSFWHISNSRNIYEPVVILTVSIISYWALYKARENIRYLFLSLLFFFVSTWVYNTALVIFPQLFLIWMIFNWWSDRNFSAKSWILGLITLLFFLGINLTLTMSAAGGKSQTTIFLNPELQTENQTRLHRYWSSGVPLYPLFIKYERFFQVSHHLYKSYVSSIDPVYIFFTGGNNAWHNLKSIDLGNSNPVLLPFVIIGIVFVLKQWRKPSNFFLISLGLTSPLPSALTVDAPNTNRLMDLHILVIILATYGFYKSLRMIGPRWRKVMIALTATAFLLFVEQFLSRYFIIYNKVLASEWQVGFSEVVTEISARQADYDLVVVESPVSAAYIYYAFYNRLAPQKLQAAPRADSQNFNPVKRIDNVIFEVDGEVEFERDQRVLLVKRFDNQTPVDESVFVVKNWEGKPIWQGYEEDF